MKKNLLFTTAIVAVALCFVDTAKANAPASSDVGIHNITQDTTITEGVSNTQLPEDPANVKSIYSNKDTETGGAPDSENVNHATITINPDLEFKDNNTGARVGGVVLNWQGNTLDVKDGVVFQGNKAEGFGSAIHSEGAWKNAGETYNAEKLHSTLKVGDNVKFIGNEATGDAGAGIYGWGGAVSLIGNQTATFGNNVLFEENMATGGGAAINAITEALDDEAVVDDGLFSDTGPLAVTIGDNATFKDNIGKQNGGAIRHYVNDSEDIIGSGSSITFGKNATFEGNKSRRGGAIYNWLNQAGENKTAEAVVNFGDGAVFKNNLATYVEGVTAGTLFGGAIDNLAGTINFNGSVKFSGNKVGTDEEHLTPNDINNTGVINFNGATTLDGGITGNGTVNFAEGAALNATVVTGDNAYMTTFDANTVNFAGNNTLNKKITTAGTLNFNGDATLDQGIKGTGTVNFARGTTLTATLDTTTIEAATVNFATGAGDEKTTLKLIIANGTDDANYDFITATTLNGTGEDDFEIATNALYDLELITEAGEDFGKISVAKKSAQAVVESVQEVLKETATPVKEQEVKTVAAVISSNGNGTGVGNMITDRISEALQTGNAAEVVQAVKDLAPTTSQQVMGVAQGVNNMLSNVTGGRMAAVSGRSGGDVFKGGALWAQGLKNYTRQDATADSAGFKSHSAGVAMGIDGKVNDALTIGFGYGFTRTDADSTGRSVDVDGHNFFVYGSYQPSAWYVDTMLSYGVSKYTEKKAPMGVAMTAKYDVKTYAANIMTGYASNSGITPEGGLRYVYADQEAYNDGAQRISTDGSDVLTAVMGVKYEKDIPVSNYKVKPSLRLAATYDLVSDNSKANINVIGGGSYEIVGKRLNRLGGEFGAGVTGTFGKWDLSLEYNGGFRQDYQSHTGLIKAQYNF